MPLQYQKICSRADINKLNNLLPQQIRQAVLILIESDPSSYFYYQLTKSSIQTHLFIIEHNLQEKFTMCHCFSTDICDKDYTYESMPLSKIQMLFKITREISIT